MAINRRGGWFLCSLAGCVVLTGIGVVSFLTTQSSKNTAATAPVQLALRPLSSALPGPAAALSRSESGLDAPLVTGSLGTASRASVPTPSLATARALLQQRNEAEASAEGPSTAVERAAAMAAHAAIMGLAPPSQPVDKPTVLGETAPTLRLASLAAPANLTVLTKRMPAPGSAAHLPSILTHTTSVADGDTLYDILERYGVSTTEAVAMARALSPIFKPQALRKGQELTLTLQTNANGAAVPQSLVINTDQGEVEVARDDKQRWAARSSAIAQGRSGYRRAVAGIEGSLYRTAREQGVPDAVIVTMMRTHSYDVDFQREIHAGDPFEVFYAASQADELDSAERGQLLFSSLTTKGKTRSYYRFTTVDGVTDYYDAKGVSSKKPLMRTPVNGARMSSGFGMRRHPILGYTKMHGGTDFAAPTGTPILAAGDGKVEFAGRNGGYGNYVKLKHKDGLQTAYAHMSRFAKGIRPGKRVYQGDVIGYVGSTGASTGPHLHYEVLVNGKKKNPLTVKVAGGGRKLEGNELASFKTELERIDALRAEVPVESQVAAAQP